jgi:hypothetical protein
LRVPDVAFWVHMWCVFRLCFQYSFKTISASIHTPLQTHYPNTHTHTHQPTKPTHPSTHTHTHTHTKQPPSHAGATHWGQQSFFLHPPIDYEPGDKLACEMEVVRRSDNHRLMAVQVSHTLQPAAAEAPQRAQHVSRFQIE